MRFLPQKSIFAALIVVVSFAGVLSSLQAEQGHSERAPREPATESLRQKVADGKLDDAAIDRLLELHRSESTEVRLVMVPATVVNKKGRAVRGLGPEDFSLRENAAEQEIQFFSAEAKEPISVAFLLDLSGSMRRVGKLLAAKEAISYFVRSLRPGDRFGLVGFADDQVTWITDFTSDADEFLARLNVQRAYGQTALYDAVAATPEIVDSRIQGRKAIILITDGIDNASTMNMFDAVRLARSVNVPIYTIGFSHLPPKLLRSGSKERNLRVMELFATETGGAVYSVFDPDELKEAVAEIQDELRLQYLIGYHPAGNPWDGSFRRIELKTQKQNWTVRARRGYYANPR